MRLSCRFYYAKNMNVDEAYVFVCYDSRKDRVRFTPHTGKILRLTCLSVSWKQLRSASQLLGLHHFQGVILSGPLMKLRQTVTLYCQATERRALCGKYNFIKLAAVRNTVLAYSSLLPDSGSET